MKKIIYLLVLIFVASPITTVHAAPCSDQVREETAKNIAKRERTNTDLQIARANVELELQYQTGLTRAFEQKYTAALASTASYTQSIRPLIRTLLESYFAKASTTRARESSKAIERRRKAVLSAEKSHTKAFQNVVPPTCTL